MKGKFFFVMLVLLSSQVLFAQSDTIRLKEISENKKPILTDRPPQAFYFLLGGSGPLLSAHYDRRFAKKVNGFGFSAGLGYYGISGISIFSIPVALNYLAGHDSHFFEIAAGATFLTAKFSGLFSDANGSVIFYHINLGYRYQPTRGGFFFRGGLCPIFFNGGYVTSYYLGFGHNF